MSLLFKENFKAMALGPLAGKLSGGYPWQVTGQGAINDPPASVIGPVSTRHLGSKDNTYFFMSGLPRISDLAAVMADFSAEQLFTLAIGDCAPYQPNGDPWGIVGSMVHWNSQGPENGNYLQYHSPSGVEHLNADDPGTEEYYAAPFTHGNGVKARLAMHLNGPVCVCTVDDVMVLFIKHPRVAQISAAAKGFYIQTHQPTHDAERAFEVAVWGG